MNNGITVSIKLFGVLRTYSDNNQIEIKINNPISILDIKSKLIEALSNNNEHEIKEIILKSAIGNEKEILQDDALISTSANLAILPPVCGG